MKSFANFSSIFNILFSFDTKVKEEKQFILFYFSNK